MWLNKRFGSGVIALLAWNSVAWSEPVAAPAIAPTPNQGKSNAKPEEEKHYFRTVLFEALALGAGTAWYWIDRERQVADWDFPSWSERLTTDVIRYDNNPFNINFAWHAFNGSGYHALARSNGLGFWQSAGAGFLSSLVWEYALEFREKVSVNDLIFTTGVGIPMGEFFHVLGRYLSLDPDASKYSPARFTAGFPMALTGMLDNRPPASASTRPEFWHKLHLDYRLASSAVHQDGGDDSHYLHSLHFDGRFVTLPRYRKPRSWSHFFHAAEFTSATVEFSKAANGDATRIYSDATVLGYYRQRSEPGDRLIGTMLGVSMAYRYQREEIGDWDSRVAVFHFPGLAADLYFRSGDISLETETRLHYDFAGVNALSNDDWNAAHPDSQGKTILRKQGYYYGYGPSASLSARLRYRQFELGASIWAAYYQSDEGLDRIQEDLSIDQTSSDSVLDTKVWFRLHNLFGRAYLGGEMADLRRNGRLEEFQSEASLRRYALQMGIEF